MEQQSKKYSIAFKLNAVALSKEGAEVSAVARELGISVTTLKNWRKRDRLDSSATIVPKFRSKEEENIRLRKELNEVKLERDILKKAVGIFSKSDR